MCESRGGSPGSLTVRTVSVDVKQHLKKNITTELRSCVKVEVADLGSLFLIVLMVSVDVKQHLKKNITTELRSCVKVEVDVLSLWK